MEETREIIFGMNEKNDYMGSATCPFCNKIVVYHSYESGSTISGCEHIYKTKRIESPLGLEMVFKS